MIVKMIKCPENKMEKMEELINKDLEELRNKHTEIKSSLMYYYRISEIFCLFKISEYHL